MKPGPKPKPTAVLKLSGAYRADRHADAHPEPPVSAPERPAHLQGEALAEWDRITGQLVALGIVSRIDRAALAGYCSAWGRMVAAEATIAAEGLTIATGEGMVRQHPAVRIAVEAASEVRRFAAEFGMTPSSRRNVKASADDDGLGTLAQFARAAGGEA